MLTCLLVELRVCLCACLLACLVVCSFVCLCVCLDVCLFVFLFGWFCFAGSFACSCVWLVVVLVLVVAGVVVVVAAFWSFVLKGLTGCGFSIITPRQKTGHCYGHCRRDVHHHDDHNDLCHGANPAAPWLHKVRICGL